MKEIILFCLSIALLTVIPEKKIFGERVTIEHSHLGKTDKAKMIIGDWSGELNIGPMKLTLILHTVEDEAGSLAAKIDCLEQNMLGIPVDAISFQNGALKFEIGSLKANFEGIFKKDQNEISGQFTQAGMSLPLIFRPGIKIAEFLKRPQEPKQPFPYMEEEVSYQNPFADGVTLSGTLTLPKGAGPFPTVLLIAGSGAHNRNEEVCGHKIFLVIADYLTRQGIGVLRVDKRGCGKSSGNYEMATTEDFAKDVIAGIEYLKTRKEVNSAQIGLIGHSEGGLVAPMAAAKSKDAAFIVLMAGPGVNGEEILLKQGSLIQKAEKVQEDHISFEHKLRSDIFKVLKEEPNLEISEKRLREVYAKHLASMPPSQRKEIEDTLEASIKKVNTPWFRFFLTFEPMDVLQEIKVPVLALNGGLDMQVHPSQNLPVISKGLEKAGNKDYTTVELPHLNHLFQTCETGALSEYAKIEETVSPKALHLISDWILERTAKNNQIKK